MSYVLDTPSELARLVRPMSDTALSIERLVDVDTALLCFHRDGEINVEI